MLFLKYFYILHGGLISNNLFINHYGVILNYNVGFFIQGVQQKSSKLLKKRIVKI